MAKSKQDKFTEKLRQVQVNNFSSGLNMDLHPLTMPNTALSDCINGTTITYNDNEFVLQNERGNTEVAELTPGFVPIGMKEHNGIIYIVSHNPNSKEIEIGTYPSPISGNIINEKEILLQNDALDKGTSYFSKRSLNINWSAEEYTNRDFYQITDSNENKLYNLKFFILSKYGKKFRIKVKNDTKKHRFNFTGKSKIGWAYMPIEIDKFNIMLGVNAYNKNGIYLQFESKDEELLNNMSNFSLNVDISITLKNENDKPKEINISQNINLENSLLKGLKSYFWELPFTNVTKTHINYDGTDYTICSINVTPELKYNSYTLIYDNLIKTLDITSEDLYEETAFVTTYKYKIDDEDDKSKITFTLNFDFTKHDGFDDGWFVEDIGDFDVMLTDVVSWIKTPQQNVAQLNSFDYQINNSDYKIFTKDSIAYFDEDYKNVISINNSTETEPTCNEFKPSATKFVFSKKNNVEYINDGSKTYSLCSTQNPWLVSLGTIENLTFDIDKTKQYILTVTYTIKRKPYKLNFLVIPEIANITNVTRRDRYDLIYLDDWYTYKSSIQSYSSEDLHYFNNTELKEDNIESTILNALKKLDIYDVEPCEFKNQRTVTFNTDLADNSYIKLFDEYNNEIISDCFKIDNKDIIYIRTKNILFKSKNQTIYHKRKYLDEIFTEDIIQRDVGFHNVARHCVNRDNYYIKISSKATNAYEWAYLRNAVKYSGIYWTVPLHTFNGYSIKNTKEEHKLEIIKDNNCEASKTDYYMTRVPEVTFTSSTQGYSPAASLILYNQNFPSVKFPSMVFSKITYKGHKFVEYNDEAIAEDNHKIWIAGNRSDKLQQFSLVGMNLPTNYTDNSTSDTEYCNRINFLWKVLKAHLYILEDTTLNSKIYDTYKVDDKYYTKFKFVAYPNICKFFDKNDFKLTSSNNIMYLNKFEDPNTTDSFVDLNEFNKFEEKYESIWEKWKNILTSIDYHSAPQYESCKSVYTDFTEQMFDNDYITDTPKDSVSSVKKLKVWEKMFADNTMPVLCLDRSELSDERYNMIKNPCNNIIFNYNTDFIWNPTEDELNFFSSRYSIHYKYKQYE